MNASIKLLPEKKLVGLSRRMSLADNKTGELWKNFMRRHREVQNRIGNAYYSMQVYDDAYFENFNPDNAFEKWATVEVADFSLVPDGMKTHLLESGLYAVFLHKGSSTDNSTFQYIYGTWLPNSPYVVANRPHFELLGEKYQNEDPNSEEAIWIPIKPRDMPALALD